MEYRDATQEDLPLIVHIYNSTVPGRMVTADTEAVTVESKRTWFLSHQPASRPIWMVENEGQTVGWVSFRDFYGRPAYRTTAEISIYLHPDHRGRKLGKEILQYSISQCPRLGVRQLLGFIFAHNIPSIKLFEQAGFTRWGLLPDVAVMDNQSYSLSIYGLTIS